jgi:hypothetical protein
VSEKVAISWSRVKHMLLNCWVVVFSTADSSHLALPSSSADSAVTVGDRIPPWRIRSPYNKPQLQDPAPSSALPPTLQQPSQNHSRIFSKDTPAPC